VLSYLVDQVEHGKPNGFSTVAFKRPSSWSRTGVEQAQAWTMTQWVEENGASERSLVMRGIVIETLGTEVKKKV
jgi:hypothetical protein